MLLPVQRRTGLTVAAVMTVLAIGVCVYAARAGIPLRYADERQYLEIAQNLRQGKGFALGGRPSAYRPPAWPLVVAAFLAIGLPASLVTIIPALFLIAAALIASILGQRLTNSPWGLIAGILILMYPLNVYTAATLYPQSFATFLLVALWWCALSISEGRPSVLKYILAGALVALLTLSVPTLAFAGAIVAVWIIWISRGSRLSAAIWLSVSSTIPIGLWALRNLYALGSPVWISTSGGLNLYIGNNATATATSGVDVHLEMPQGLDEVSRDGYLREAAIHWVVQHPAEAASLYVAKFLNYFTPYNAPVTPTGASNTQRVIAYVSFGILLAAVALRFILRKYVSLQSTEKLFITLFVANAFVMALFFTRTRFRQPLDNILIIESACAVAIALTVLRTRPWRPGIRSPTACRPSK